MAVLAGGLRTDVKFFLSLKVLESVGFCLMGLELIGDSDICG